MSEQTKRKRTPEEILAAIEEADAADEAERILALSDEELDKELAGAGFDPEELRAKGRAIGERFASEAGLSRPAHETKTPSTGSTTNGAPVIKLPGPSRKTLRAWWLALPAAAALTAGAAAISTSVVVVGRGRTTTVDQEKAAALREKAHGECAEKKWKGCLDDLDAARTLDPNGENEAVRRERLAAQEALGGAR